MEKVDRSVVRNLPYQKGSIGIRERHNERKNESYANPDIELERSHCAYAGMKLVEKLCCAFRLTWDAVFPLELDACANQLVYAVREYLLDGGNHNMSLVEQTFEVMARMRNQCESAKQDSAEEMNFRQFFLCQWIYSATRWLPMDKYDKGAEPIDMEALKGHKCYGGLDLASTADIAAFVLIFPPDNETEKYIILPFFWIPGDNIPRRIHKHHVPYDKWEKDGFLNATEGSVIHYEFIEQKILDLRSVYEIQEVAFDDWGATQMIQWLQELSGIQYIPFRQGYKSLSPPSKELMRLVLNEKIQQGGHPVLRWMFNNVFIETDAAGNIKPSKEKSSEKIDGAVAAIMALDRALRHETHGSVYDTRGLLVFGGDSDW